MSQENETHVEELETEQTDYGNDESDTQEEDVQEQEQEQPQEEEVDWQERALKAERAIEKAKRKEKQAKPAQDDKEPTYDQELINRTYLAAQADIKDSDVQDEALRLADKFGMSIAEAVKDQDISTRLKNMQKQKQSQAAIAKATGGSSKSIKDVDYYMTYYNRNGDFPDGTPNSMIAQVTKRLAS